MRYLLDTHTFLWMAAEPEMLSANVLEIIAKGSNMLFMSAASGWKIALLQQLSIIELPDDPQRFVPEAMQAFSIQPLPIGFQTAISAAMLPLIHRDPFDRIIIAEASRQNMTILTKDKMFNRYDVQSEW